MSTPPAGWYPTPSPTPAPTSGPPRRGRIALLALIVVVATIGVGALTYLVLGLLTGSPDEASGSASSAPSPSSSSLSSSSAPSSTTTSALAPANADATGGFVVGADGVVGEPTPGAPTLEVYLDLMCPYCAEFEAVNADDLTRLREDGTLNVSYHVVSILDRASTTDYSTRAANAVTTVAADSPEHVVAFLDLLFTEQPAEGGPGLDDAEIASLALAAGVPQDVVDTFPAGTWTAWVGEMTELARQDGIAGTPTLRLEGDKVEDVNYFTAGELAAWIEDQSTF